MMRYLRYAFLATLGILLVSVSLANRQLVELKLMPDPLSELLGFNLTTSLPLFLVVLGGVVAGLIIGFLWEWLREHKHRRDATVKRPKCASLSARSRSSRKSRTKVKTMFLPCWTRQAEARPCQAMSV